MPVRRRPADERRGRAYPGHAPDSIQGCRSAGGGSARGEGAVLTFISRYVFTLLLAIVFSATRGGHGLPILSGAEFSHGHARVSLSCVEIGSASRIVSRRHAIHPALT